MFERLRSNEDFQRVYKNGKSRANKNLVMYICKNELDKNRYGFSVSKKIGNSVVRHRITRLFRECIRQDDEMIRTSYDIVIIARGMAKGKGLKEIESSIIHLCKLQGILK